MDADPLSPAFPEIEALLRDELRCVAVQAGRQPAGATLLLQASAAWRGVGEEFLPRRAVRQHVSDALLAGDVACAPAAMPWEDAAFTLIVVQHAGGRLGEVDGLFDELARVLAPGGMLLWFGFNPRSPWYLRRHWDDGAAAPGIDGVRRQFLRSALTPQIRGWLGPVWPSRGTGSDGLLGPLRAAYLLGATRQPMMPTLLRSERVRAVPALPRQVLVASNRQARA